MGVLEELREHRLRRPDGRTVAWTEWGAPDGVPLLRHFHRGYEYSVIMQARARDREPWAKKRADCLAVGD